MSTAGKFIVIEGTDGSGKGTHTKLLIEWLRDEGKEAVQFEFPRHGQTSAYFADKYLSGGYGGLNQTGPEKGSLFYAMDRYDASFDIRDSQATGSIIVADRYVGSNMAHQGGKIDTATGRQDYFKWNDNLEYEILGIPRPDLNIVLRMPAEQAQKFVDQKKQRDYINDGNRDIHENDLNHLQKAEQTYAEIVELFPDNFVEIACVENGHVRSIEDIQSDIQALVRKLIV